MSNKREWDYQTALADVINDQIQLRLVVQGLQNFEEDQQKPKNDKKGNNSSRIDVGDRGRMNVQELVNREELNFREDLDIEGGRKYKSFKPYQPPKFKLLGFNVQGKPLYKMSDIFLTTDPTLLSIINKHIQQITHSSKAQTLETGELSRKQEKGYDFSKLIDNWQKKQYEDFTNDKKNKMDEKELEEIVVNRGDAKEKYWVYKVGERRRGEYRDIYEGNVGGYEQGDQENRVRYNYNLLNPNFPVNMHKAANQKRAQYYQIQQFQSDEQPAPSAQAPAQAPKSLQPQLWGQYKCIQDPSSLTKAPNPVKSALIEEQIRDIVSIDANKKDAGGKTVNIVNTQNRNYHSTFVEEIIKEFSTVNWQIANNRYRGKESINQYNRIQFHLENPNFFLTKLHYALQKKSQQFSNFIQGNNKNISQLQLNKNISAASAIGLDRSIISGSRTGNQQTVRASQLQKNQGFNQDDDHQTIQNKIHRQMSSQPKKPINHSQVATKLYFIKFSNQTQDFRNYHRFEFRYDFHFENPTKISLVRNTKPLKCKGNDLNINVEKKDSYIKFSKPESLSLASGDNKEFVLIEYIEENPLLLSDVGMCERMVLQVNNKELLQKINKDIIQQKQFEDFEEIRDNPNSNKDKIQSTTQHKMELWRKNIKNYFGQNGKVYLWEPKRQSKLIGNPDGFGVALMQSNLSNMPIVKKTPNKRDFLLVREKDRWVIRKIDSLYVSGQVQPKQVVFSPGDRPYQTFLEKYQVDYLMKVALNSPNYKISIQLVKNGFPNTPQTSAQARIRKILKQKMDTETKDNKIYLIKSLQTQQVKFKLQPQQFCLFQRMQKSLCSLEDVGIRCMKNMQKMKSILRKYFRKCKTKDLKHFATARMIRDQLQLTSWYLTESFRKFIDKNARIQMIGHADPTNGHGGYSFIKKPQKQRTDKDQAQQRQEKSKLSGTEFDLRKLIKEQSISVLQKYGHSRKQLQKLGRWQLVYLLKSLKDTQYSRKQRQSKQLKQQNQRKQRSKALNTLLKNLKNQQQGLIQPYDYSYNPYLDIDYYCAREKNNWQLAKQKLEKMSRMGEQNDQNQEDGDDQD